MFSTNVSSNCLSKLMNYSLECMYIVNYNPHYYPNNDRQYFTTKNYSKIIHLNNISNTRSATSLNKIKYQYIFCSVRIRRLRLGLHGPRPNSGLA